MVEAIEVSSDDARYPKRLTRLYGSKAPDTLHCMGNLELLNKDGVGFCGSRKSSERGLATAADCASQAAESDIVVVSGNAAGVDEVAHYEALRAGGSTILVLPEGLSNFRVRKNLRDVWDWGRVLVVSQFKADTVWRAYQAMARNKTIIGLSRAMIVIEAGEKGGTLAAGRQTLDANMPLFVADYEILRPEAKGNSMLLNLGAFPLKRLRSTERANMDKVWASFDSTNVAVRNPRLI